MKKQKETIKKQITINITELEYEIFITFLTIMNSTPQEWLWQEIEFCIDHCKGKWVHDIRESLQQMNLFPQCKKIFKNYSDYKLDYEISKQLEALKKIRSIAIENNKIRQKYDYTAKDIEEIYG